MPLLKSHRRSSSEEDASYHHDDGRHRRSAFTRTPTPDTTDDQPTRRGSFLARFRLRPSRNLHDDPAIKAAKQKVTVAEQAEGEADKALELARRAVRAARQHVRDLEAAALQEIKQARAKQHEVKTVRRIADRLGRHDAHS